MSKTLKIGVFSTYVPRECGIATFARDTLAAIRVNHEIETKICAISNSPTKYSPEVNLAIDQQTRSDYKKAAEFFNESDVDVVLIQHEFGIFGGSNGRYILDFMRALKKPTVVTLHTVPFLQVNRRRRTQLKYLRKILVLADKIIVPISIATDFFVSQKFPESVTENCVAIPHGSIVGSDDHWKTDPQLPELKILPANSVTITTFGLITIKKGIHIALKAMKELIKIHPELQYIIAGRPHPNKPSSYYFNLHKFVKANGLSKNVQFVDRYLTNGEVSKLMDQTDIYLTPYLGKEQVSSGTLAYSVASGRTVVSTPYPFAKELLANGRGKFIEFGSVSSLVETLDRLVSSRAERTAISHKAEVYGKYLAWPHIGDRTYAVLKECAKIVK